MCGTCNRFTSFRRARLMSKGASVYKCNTCHNRQQVLRRIYGQWPNEQFSELSTAAQQQFMASIADMSSAQQMIEELEMTVHQSQSSTNEYLEEGSYHPLSYWNRQGYDVEAIKTFATPSDVMIHPMFGEVYKVPIIKKSVKISTKITKQSIQRMKQARNGVAAGGVAAAAALPAPAVAEPETNTAPAVAKPASSGSSSSNSSSSSSSSASSSSSSSGKHKKKHRRNKHGKKSKKHGKKNKDKKKSKSKTSKKAGKDKKRSAPSETPTQKRARLAAENKERTMNKKWASMIVSKLSGFVALLKGMQKSDYFEDLPENMSDNWGVGSGPLGPQQQWRGHCVGRHGHDLAERQAQACQERGGDDREDLEALGEAMVAAREPACLVQLPPMHMQSNIAAVNRKSLSSADHRSKSNFRLTWQLHCRVRRSVYCGMVEPVS